MGASKLKLISPRDGDKLGSQGLSGVFENKTIRTTWTLPEIEVSKIENF